MTAESSFLRLCWVALSIVAKLLNICFRVLAFSNDLTKSQWRYPCYWMKDENVFSDVLSSFPLVSFYLYYWNWHKFKTLDNSEIFKKVFGFQRFTKFILRKCPSKQPERLLFTILQILLINIILIFGSFLKNLC